MRRTNAAGIALIKSFEGLRLQAYLCPTRRREAERDLYLTPEAV
jgi:GH24 family phage-related lysozyme (muramidase)